MQPIKESVILESTATLVRTHTDSIDKIFLPYREQQTISILFKNGRTHYYHPISNTLLGEKSASIEFFENLLVLHRTLGIPKIGKYIVGSSAIVFFLLLLTSGFHIWWNLYGHSLKKGFKIAWKGKKKKLDFDLHKALGAYFIVPLFIMAVSGAYFTYNASYKTVLQIIDGNEKESDNQHMPMIKGSTSLIDLITDQDRGYVIWAIYFPLEKTEPYKIRYIRERNIESGPRRTKEMTLDTSGAITTLSDYGTDTNSQRIAAQFYPIHIGEMAGTPGRILVFVSGMVPLILFITGLRIYMSKRKKKQNRPRDFFRSRPLGGVGPPSPDKGKED